MQSFPNFVIFSDDDVSITAKYAKQNGGIQGATFPDGRIVLVLENLNADNFDGVFLHEGWHSAVRELIGEDNYRQIMRRLDSLLSSGAKWVADARNAVPLDTKAENITEEIGAYAIESHVNGKPLPLLLKRWAENFLSMLRAAIIRHLPDGKLKLWAEENIQPQDLARLAIAGLKAKAQGQLQAQGREAMAFSKAEESEFSATERAYGGREAYDLAKSAGRTKLNYRQWVQVRTPAFKAWFGDWEALRAQRRLDAMPSVKVRVPEEWRGLDESAMRAKMMDAMEQLSDLEEPIIHPELGEISIGRKGKEKTKNTSKDPAKMLVVADLARLIPQSIYARSDVPTSKEQGVDGYGSLLLPIDVDGIELVARITVRHQPDGHWYYNSIALSDRNEKAQDSYGSPGTLSRPLGWTPIAGLDSFIRQPLRRVNPDTVSKVVDTETGEPLVVYHSSLKDLERFNRTGRFMGHAGTSGISLTDNPEMASRYLERYAEYGWVDGKPNQPFDNSVMALYVNAKNPLYRDEPFQTNMRLGAPLPDNYVSPVVRMGRDAMIRNDAISRRGGVKHNHAKNSIRGHEIIVFDPTQVKSATGNTGAFDSDNPDIRYSKTLRGQEENTSAAKADPGSDDAPVVFRRSPSQWFNESRTTISGDSHREHTAEQKQFFRDTGRAVTHPSVKDKLKGLWQNAGKKLAQGLVDQFAPLKDLSKHAYILARLSKATSGAFEALLKFGKLSLVDGVYDADMSGGVIERLFAPLQGEGEDFLWWVAANRAARLREETAAAHQRAYNIRAQASEMENSADEMERSAKEMLQQAGDFPKSMTGNQRAQKANAAEAERMLREARSIRREVAEMRAEASDLAAINRERLFTEEHVLAGKSLAEGDADFDYTLQHGPRAGESVRSRELIYNDALKTLDEFNKNVMDMAEQSGLIDGEARKLWEHEFYVPFYRANEEDGSVRGMNIKSATVRQVAFNALKGGTDKLNSDLMANTLQNWAHLIDASAKNRAATESLRAASLVGAAEPSLKSGLEWDDGQVFSAETGELVGDGTLKPEHTADRYQAQVGLDGGKRRFLFASPAIERLGAQAVTGAVRFLCQVALLPRFKMPLPVCLAVPSCHLHRLSKTRRLLQLNEKLQVGRLGGYAR